MKNQTLSMSELSCACAPHVFWKVDASCEKKSRKWCLKLFHVSLAIGTTITGIGWCQSASDMNLFVIGTALSNLILAGTAFRICAFSLLGSLHHLGAVFQGAGRNVEHFLVVNCLRPAFDNTALWCPPLNNPESIEVRSNVRMKWESLPPPGFCKVIGTTSIWHLGSISKCCYKYALWNQIGPEAGGNHNRTWYMRRWRQKHADL